MIEPDPASQRFLCPNRRVVYECRIVVPSSFGLSWIIDSTILEFSANANVLLNSTLLIQPPLHNLNGSLLTCKGGTAVDPVNNNITIAITRKSVNDLKTISFVLM